MFAENPQLSERVNIGFKSAAKDQSGKNGDAAHALYYEQVRSEGRGTATGRKVSRRLIRYALGSFICVCTVSEFGSALIS
jgi:hypothetical protein